MHRLPEKFLPRMRSRLFDSLGSGSTRTEEGSGKYDRRWHKKSCRGYILHTKGQPVCALVLCDAIRAQSNLLVAEVPTNANERETARKRAPISAAFTRGQIQTLRTRKTINKT